MAPSGHPFRTLLAQMPLPRRPRVTFWVSKRGGLGEALMDISKYTPDIQTYTPNMPKDTPNTLKKLKQIENKYKEDMSDMKI